MQTMKLLETFDFFVNMIIIILNHNIILIKDSEI